ncbi:hypothetical protein AB0L85_03285 [Streptomyces sp. NPDC052051]
MPERRRGRLGRTSVAVSKKDFLAQANGHCRDLVERRAAPRPT